MPIFYECDRCTACCRWPGQVRITDAEISAMAAHLSISEPDFIARYTRLHTSRAGLALEDKPSGECIFLDGNECRVNPVKPRQCRNFPNLWNFPGFQEVCRAKPIVMTQPDYAAALKKATAIPNARLPEGQAPASPRQQPPASPEGRAPANPPERRAPASRGPTSRESRTYRNR